MMMSSTREILKLLILAKYRTEVRIKTSSITRAKYQTLKQEMELCLQHQARQVSTYLSMSILTTEF